jgi:glycerophosphoryl diester phosphodiesterase
LHDDTLQRTTSGYGPAIDQSWAELSQLDAGSWHSRGFAGEPLASLRAVARYVLRNGFHLNIEIKPSPGHEEATGRTIAHDAAELWRDAETPPLLSSFKPTALEAAREAAPALPRALILDTLWPGWFETAKAFECVAVVTNHALQDAALVSQLRDAGLRALAYTVNDPAAAQRLLQLKVNGIITDAVDRFAPAEAASGQFD